MNNQRPAHRSRADQRAELHDQAACIELELAQSMDRPDRWVRENEDRLARIERQLQEVS
jgi:hypothetical protein